MFVCDEASTLISIIWLGLSFDHHHQQGTHLKGGPYQRPSVATMRNSSSSKTGASTTSGVATSRSPVKCLESAKAWSHHSSLRVRSPA